MRIRFTIKFGTLLLPITALMIGQIDALYAQRAVIAADDVAIYALPLVDDGPVATLVKGDTVRVLGQRGGWVKIGFGTGRKGWMQIRTPRKVKLAHNHASNGHATQEVASVRTETNGLASQMAMKPETESVAPDVVASPPPEPDVYRRFGYSFGMGLVQLDYTYNWKFVFHSTPRLALEGSFKHVLGSSADSYFIMANLSYLLKKDRQLLPYITGGLGVINTVPDRSIDSDAISNMAINYGVGARKYLSEKLSVTFAASQYLTFVKNGTKLFNEVTVGILVGRFWD